MSLDWRTIILVVLVLAGLFWQEEIREVLFNGWGLLLSGIVIPPFEETFEAEPIQIVLPEPSDEIEDKWTAVAKIDKPEEWQEVKKEIQKEPDAAVVEQEPISLSKIQVEIEKVAEETAIVSEKVNRLLEEKQKLAEMQELINEISQKIEVVSQETVELINNLQVG